MLALRSLSQKGLPVQPLSGLIHRVFRTFCSSGDTEQRTEGNSLRKKTSIVTPTTSKRERPYKKKMPVRIDDSDLTVDSSSFSHEADMGKTKWAVNAKHETENVKDLVKELRTQLRGNKSGSRRYLLDRDAAEKLVRHLKKDLRENDVIVETCPGPGVLTRTLLTQTDNDVIVYEPNDNLRTSLLNTLCPQYLSCLQVHGLDLQKFYAYYIGDQREPEQSMVYELLNPLPIKGDRTVSPVKIVGVIFDFKFFIRLVLSFAFQCCFYEEVFPVLYLYIPSKIYNRIALDSDHVVYNYISIPFQYYFHLEYLDVAPREGFYPPGTWNSREKSTATNSLHLVKISPNLELFEMVPKEELVSFHYFLNTVSRIRKAESLIMCLEKWVPDCGPQLIKNGFRVFCHPRELTSEQLLLAYKIFTSLPLYEESVFHYQCKQFAAKYGEKDEEITNLNMVDEIIDLEENELMES